jgi:hypothetical protein
MVPWVTILRSRSRAGSSRARAAITARSAQSGLGRATVLACYGLLLACSISQPAVRNPDRQPDS